MQFQCNIMQLKLSISYRLPYLFALGVCGIFLFGMILVLCQGDYEV